VFFILQSAKTLYNYGADVTVVCRRYFTGW